MTAQSGLLELWLALELRRARAAFDQSRKKQDADFEAKGMRKTGARVKLTLRSASEICVGLADSTIAKAAELQSSPTAVADARAKVEAFTREVTNSAIPLAYFVSGETGLGGSTVKAANQLAGKLCADVSGAFILAAHQHEAQEMQHASPSPAIKRRGRTKGSGSLEAWDAPLLQEMKTLITEGRAFSPDGAAKLVAYKAKGGGTEANRATRLANRYRASEKI